jgi:hypothetical protein
MNRSIIVAQIAEHEVPVPKDSFTNYEVIPYSQTSLNPNNHRRLNIPLARRTSAIWTHLLSEADDQQDHTLPSEEMVPASVAVFRMIGG